MRSRRIVAVAALLLVVGCSTESGLVEVPDTPAADGAVDAGVDASVLPDRVPAEDTLWQETEVQPLDTPAELPSACEGEGGCFLDPCQENVDCQSAWCVEHLGEGVCTRTCQEDCPPGWLCKQVGAADPDLLFVCVSQHANLCKPCKAGVDCKTIGGVDDVCVDYGVEGAFCGGTCAEDANCPWGFACEETLTVDGIDTFQCVAEAGVCPCTDKSVALSLWTACEVANAFGTCAGMRVCAEDGLTDCDAATPAAETCNGIDDDCDGEIDEPTVLDRRYEDLCDHQNPTTEDGCAGAAGCTHAALSEGECVDGDACTVGDHCEAGVCLGSPIACDDDNPCTDDVCDGLGGCDFIENAADCDDGSPCTVADQCEAGVCVGVAVACDCQSDGDCAALDDGDVCNGTLFCDTGSVPYECVIDPATVVTCPAPEGDSAFCLQAVCDPASGTCSFAPDHEGLLCDDGDPCTVGATCQEGVCLNGAPVNCTDGNPCTDDLCQPGAGCAHVPNNEPCDDGSLCTTGDVCEDGVCGYAGLLDCADDNVCTDDSSSPATGCIHALNQAPCNDGDVCTLDDHCHLGECIGGGALPCDDMNPCTDDACNPLSGCSFTANDAPCDDGDPCSVGDQCGQGWCLPGPALDCADDDPCTLDGACVDGACVGGGALDCDDDNPCTDDSCEPMVGCVHADNAAPCEDGNACTTGDQCVDGACVTGVGALECADDNPCTDDGCNPEIGCIFVNNSVPCSDDDACTEPDLCADGACMSGAPVICADDGNTCTVHACDVESGCVTTTLPDCCGNGVPEAGEECDDGNQDSGDGCSDLCVSEVGSCFGDWMVGLPCNGVDYGGGCTAAETGYHWKGIYGSYACWWNTKNQAWNSTATNPYQLAQFFGLDVGTGKVQWCSSYASTPSPSSYSSCTSYCSISDDHMWGWCGGAPFQNGGWICFHHAGKQACN